MLPHITQHGREWTYISVACYLCCPDEFNHSAAIARYHSTTFSLYCHSVVPLQLKFVPSHGEYSIIVPLFGPTRPTTPNGISIQLAVFPKYTVVTNGLQTDRTNTELNPYQYVARCI